MKFSPQGGQLRVTIEQNKTQTRVSVSNEGVPIPEESREQIFRKFYQADESHASEGNGVGLTIVSRILVLCKGHVAVDSAPDMGTAFTVTLPLTNVPPHPTEH